MEVIAVADYSLSRASSFNSFSSDKKVRALQLVQPRTRSVGGALVLRGEQVQGQVDPVHGRGLGGLGDTVQGELGG